jgi:uncharacterized protein (DUF1330 family)
MAAYVIVDVDVHEPDADRDYQRQVPDTLAPFGGRFIVRGGKAETLEGHWQPQRVVVLEFPSVDQARAWHASQAYQAIIPIRQRNATTHFLTLVEGV